jgi:hypothetical protein
MYKLFITKQIENPDYEEQMKSYNDKWSGRNMDYPLKYIAGRSLEVELTDEEFMKLKSETIKIFK